MTTLHNIFVYITDIESQGTEQGRIHPELAEHADKLPQVFPQERIRLPFRHGFCRIPFPRQKFVTPTNIRVTFFRVPALKIAAA